MFQTKINVKMALDIFRNEIYFGWIILSEFAKLKKDYKKTPIISNGSFSNTMSNVQHQSKGAYLRRIVIKL